MKAGVASGRVLYITYDGLTDPLGQSQILPYLKGLSEYGYQFTILSFEKKDRFSREKKVIEKLTSESGITWVPLTFTSKPPLLSKFYDAIKMRAKAVQLHRQQNFDMVHCRSYIAADVGLYLKKKFGIKFFFDMRGFWADEKKDGSWNVSNPVFNRIYRYYKKKETQYLKHADYIISLTEAGKKEMMCWPSFDRSVPLQVIPCCADMDHFSLTDIHQKKSSRKELNIPDAALVVSYLGSIGTWYMLEEMLALFKQIKEKYSTALFLFITHSHPDQIYSKAAALGISGSDLIIKEASRSDVPWLIKASDINISFIKPTYSKISSSPTKLGEVLSMGIPVIANSGVGDVEEMIKDAQAGYILHQFNEKEFQNAVDAIPSLLQKDPQSIRAKAEAIYSLKRGISLYLECYGSLFN